MKDDKGGFVKRSLGICIGASSISAVHLEQWDGTVFVRSKEVIPHHGNPREIIEKFTFNNQIEKIALTGRKFRKLLNLTSISEAESIELTVDFLKIKSRIIVSAGGENFVVYLMDKFGKISKVTTGNKCASGTGEFFLQQTGRMNLTADEAAEYGGRGEVYKISGRCSVFCKSDCTHALNKGTPKENVIAGLAEMMANKIIELLPKNRNNEVALIGGSSLNKGMIRFLNQKVDKLIIPKEATYFEALGAAIYALKNDCRQFDKENLFNSESTSFDFHPKLSEYKDKVKFKNVEFGKVNEGDECILGLDVGSTTTKAILLRTRDNTIVASKYLRTNGDPVNASIECYKAINEQVNENIKIIGLGTTGSGRQIAGLHAGTKGIINEIIAHAAATVFFDKDVDTIFEIGGQDAKYTFITAGVASDYAMNEACSAGTGSFLEEAAKESLGIDYTKIGGIALEAETPPNFNDQCSAFISSDIKNALHEGLSKADILAGLVYSICMNYLNRVKGNRPDGKKIFMQGGVCYNHAVPIAMAALTGKEIIVPPEPGLMGAFGVALEIKKKLELGLLEQKVFELNELINRKVVYDKTFVCAGGAEKCDRKCQVAIINIDGSKIPFGGACNKYYNIQLNVKEKPLSKNLVKLRQELVFEKYIHPLPLKQDAPVIGISKSFLTNTIYPLYFNFFTQLGFRIILGNESKQEGVDKKLSSFCYPAELAHGFLHDLIEQKPDYIFLPHITEIYNADDSKDKKTCVLLQSESYYLKSTFREELDGIKILNPVLNFNKGWKNAKDAFIQMGSELGKDKIESAAAFDFAVTELNEMFNEFKLLGKQILAELKENNEFGIVLFGRAYNSFAGEANLGIPQKITSRGLTIIPHDFLPSYDFNSYRHMYWAMGQQIMQSARMVKNNDKLFGMFITNFSCGPDSFLLGYFRNIMGRKPSLTLELDSHSADAGINTRIEAFIDIIHSYNQITKNYFVEKFHSVFTPLKVKNASTIVDENGNEFSLTDKSVKMLLPPMGRMNTEAVSASFNYHGINAECLSDYDSEILKAGRGNATCKECLPLLLNAGTLIDYYEKRKDNNEKTLFFMAGGNGPCRLGQYSIFLEDLISKKEMKNFAVYNLSDEDSYGSIGTAIVRRGWLSIIIADVMRDVQSAFNAIAVDKQSALTSFENEWQKILLSLKNDSFGKIFRQLEQTAEILRTVELKYQISEAKKISIVGEIFVRHDEFSKMDLMKTLAEKEFVVTIASAGEYIYYSNLLASRDNGAKVGFADKLKFSLRDFEQLRLEKRVKKIFASAGLIEDNLIDIADIIEKAKNFIPTDLAGEAILTVGAALKEIMNHACGVISIGPFGCMPSRVAEAILNAEMNNHGILRSQNMLNVSEEELKHLPFLSIETDGNLFPQIIQSKIEIFMLNAERLHKEMKLKNHTASDSLFKFILNRVLNYYENIDVSQHSSVLQTH
ncbi:MAG: acyl-CoA dehydratase activase [bacterium]